jgi:hypothetical protein
MVSQTGAQKRLVCAGSHWQGAFSLMAMLLRTRSNFTTDSKDKMHCLLVPTKYIDVLDINPDSEEQVSVEYVDRDFAASKIRNVSAKE